MASTQPSSRRLGWNTGYLLIGNVLSTGLSFVLTIIIARGWGEAGLGFYGTVLAWIYPLSLLVEMGIGTYLTRRIAQERHSTGALVRTAVRVRWVLGGSLGIILITGATLAGDGVAGGIVIASPLLLANPLYSTFTAVMRGHEQMRPIAFLNVGMLGAQVVGTGLAWASGADILVVLAINTGSSVGQMGVAWWVYRAQYGHQGGHGIARISMITMMRASGAFAIAGVLSAIQTRGLLLVLSAVGGDVAVGIYLASWRWLEAGRLLPMAFFDALYPRLSSLVAEPQALGRLFKWANVILLGYGLVFGVIFSIGAECFIGVAFGEDFGASAGVLQVMAWGMGVLVLRQLWALYAYAWGHEVYANWATGLSMVIQLIVAVLWVGEVGIMGAVGAFIVGEVVLLGMLAGYQSGKNHTI